MVNTSEVVPLLTTINMEYVTDAYVTYMGITG